MHILNFPDTFCFLRYFSTEITDPGKTFDATEQSNKGVFSVTRILLTHADVACVVPVKNNFICVFIVKRDKRMRHAGSCTGRSGINACGRSICMRKRAYNFSVYFRVGRGARTVLY
jgi:hypothetical protein